MGDDDTTEDHFDFPNEGEVIFNPSFVCESCGYANVRLITANGKPAAKCTNCGQGYLQREDGPDG